MSYTDEELLFLAYVPQIIGAAAAIHGNYGSYGAAKAGVEGLTRSMAVEGAPYGIRVELCQPWLD